MQDFAASFFEAFRLVLGLNPGLLEIVWLSLKVSMTAVIIAAIVGLPIGAFLAVARFPGRGLLVVTITALMGLPPVVVGLVVYLLLSNAGALGPLQLLYTPTAMIIAQTILVVPIIAALAGQTLEDLNGEYRDQLMLYGLGSLARLRTLLWEGRYSLMTALLAGFGRAIAEVGAVIIVGGNINHVTRVMTTAIALETSKGNLALALGLGIILVILAILVNALVFLLRAAAERSAYA
ncbi:MAG: ABC transporter permease subunit [Hyphomicrobiales bacterium]|nr:ABC transporter permease subunit [Hyphomicrobiales bacterium]MCP5000852.1 ABC transporter permease subunit [Hyphomicrobiales bacterium]